MKHERVDARAVGEQGLGVRSGESPMLASRSGPLGVLRSGRRDPFPSAGDMVEVVAWVRASMHLANQSFQEFSLQHGFRVGWGSLR